MATEMSKTGSMIVGKHGEGIRARRKGIILNRRKCISYRQMFIYTEKKVWTLWTSISASSLLIRWHRYGMKTNCSHQIKGIIVC